MDKGVGKINNQKFTKKVIVTLKTTVIITLLFIICIFSQAFKCTNFDIYNFAVDKDEKIYIVKADVVEVYKNCKKIDTIEFSNHDVDEITVVDGDILLVFAGDGIVYRINEKKQLVEQKELQGKDFYDYQKTKEVFIDDSGTVYRWTDKFLYDSIQKYEKSSKKTVYKLSPIEYVTKIMTILSAIGFALCILRILYLDFKYRKTVNNKSNLIGFIKDEFLT